MTAELIVYLNINTGKIPQVYSRYKTQTISENKITIEDVRGCLGTLKTINTYNNIYEEAKKTGKKVVFKLDENQSKEDLKQIQKTLRWTPQDIIANSKYNLINYIKQKTNPDNIIDKHHMDKTTKEIHEIVKLYD